MNGKLDPEERVMTPTYDPKNDWIKSRSGFDTYLKVIHDPIIYDYVEDLGWNPEDEITVEIGGTQVSGIDVGEEYNKKWQSPIGTRKYNKDAFIVIKNQSRRDLTKSQPNPELKAHHAT